MATCAGCGQPIERSSTEAIRTGEQAFHLSCAPLPLLDDAREEYEAILRKGVQYFVEKYHVGSTDGSRPERLFIAMGAALEAERARRPRACTDATRSS